MTALPPSILKAFKMLLPQALVYQGLRRRFIQFEAGLAPPQAPPSARAELSILNNSISISVILYISAPLPLKKLHSARDDELCRAGDNAYLRPATVKRLAVDIYHLVIVKAYLYG